MTTKTVSESNSPVIESREQLIASFARGEKPKERWRIGTEHEKFVYAVSDHHAPSWDEPHGIRALLTELQQYGWRPVEENGNLIALTGLDGSVSLEPAGQFELSGAPLDNLHETCAETGRHLEQVKAAGEKLGIGFLGLGMWPDKTRGDLPVMPKGRYAIMLRHMPRVGSLGLDMMLRTCTIQVNLDYASEADMAQKFRVGLALQPLATALFANSPFTEGKPNGYLSYRSHIWSDTDPARTGMLPFVFEDGFGYERYAEYMLDVPMYFVYREGRYIDAAGLSFRDFLKGELPVLPGELPTRPSLHRCPRGAAQDLPRDARGGWRAVEPDLRAAGLLGRAALRSGGARRGLGCGETLDDGRARGAAQRRAQTRARRADPRWRHAARYRGRGTGDRQCRARGARAAQSLGG